MYVGTAINILFISKMQAKNIFQKIQIKICPHISNHIKRACIYVRKVLLEQEVRCVYCTVRSFNHKQEFLLHILNTKPPTFRFLYIFHLFFMSQEIFSKNKMQNLQATKFLLNKTILFIGRKLQLLCSSKKFEHGRILTCIIKLHNFH